MHSDRIEKPKFKRPLGVDSSEEDDNDYVDELPILAKRPNPDQARQSVSAEAYSATSMKQPFKPKIIPKTSEVKFRLKELLSKIFIFSSLDPKDMDIILNAMDFKRFRKGDTVIKQNDDGNELFIVEHGRLSCSKYQNGQYMQIRYYQPGEFFGELALLYNTPRQATITALEDCELLSLDRETFNHIVRDSMISNSVKFEKFLSEVPLLRNLSEYERTRLSDCLIVRNFSPGEQVIRENEPGDNFYLVIEGKATAFKFNHNTGRQEEVMHYDEKSYFGELALIRNEPRAATVVAKTYLKLACIERNSFKRILGPLEDIMKRNAESYVHF